jgi:hypothetical protein
VCWRQAFCIQNHLEAGAHVCCGAAGKCLARLQQRLRPLHDLCEPLWHSTLLLALKECLALRLQTIAKAVDRVGFMSRLQTT